jgi:hypothetical protein
MRANSAELIGTTDGAVLNPTVGPDGFVGRATVRGGGYLSFDPVHEGNGLSFHFGGQQNVDTAFVSFTGLQVGDIFRSKGEVKFTLQSAYSFAERQALPQRNLRFVYDVFDETMRKHFFTLYTTNSRLVLAFTAGSPVSSSFYVPAGQEDALFGKGVKSTIRVVWDGDSTGLWLNDELVFSAPTSPVIPPRWTAASSLVIGAQNAQTPASAGSFALDDKIAEFEVR